ncbi:alanine--tRNA ligase [Candidatus Pacearchaeota archaeon]|nr:alanine--tRNA ligase [Candidatus Pacearchaeota archaeon]
MKREELIKKYLDFFKSKKHKEIQNESLIPENDPTTLFISAGMHPLLPYLLGQSHPLGKKLCNVQKCIRTGDIEEVGDETHHTFLEMLGNWSLGDYWKKQAIEMSFEFLTKILKIQKEKIKITCFKGDKDAPKDIESEKIWKSLGINKIKFLPKSENWWGSVSKTGPCGPDTEIFVNGFEIWNNVFMQYNKTIKGKFEPLKQKNVDTGMGVERTIAVLNNLDDDYLTDMFLPIIKQIEKLSGKKYKGNEKPMRIIADHIKASVFILAEGITPSNTEQGYVLRRLIRRAIRYGKELEIQKKKDITTPITKEIIKIYSDYPELKKNQTFIIDELNKEEEKFEKTLEKGLNKFSKFAKDKKISGKEAFLLYQSYGFPLEMIEEESKKIKVIFNKKDFEKEREKHQELSRTASTGRFKSGLADDSEATTKLHTAAHLLLSSLRKVLKDKNIIQKGSNITAERLRLDFSFPRKLTEQELKEVESIVNKQIKKSCEVCKEEMSLQEAKNKGAVAIFDKKYGKKVSVYSIENFSKEICAGPHVKNTCELGNFKIIKQESSSAGIRRIKAILK